MNRFLSLALAAAVLLPGLSRAQDKNGIPVRVEKDLVFGKGGDKDLKLDLFLPNEGSGPFPAVVCVHGGSWKSGNYKATYINLTAWELAKRGYVTVSVQYRLVPEATFPAQLEDCKCAVRWLRANAQKYQIDADNIGAVGYSAGGHLVSLLGLTCKEDCLEGRGGCEHCSSHVKAVVDFFGPADLRKGDWPGRTTLKDLVGGTVQEKADAYAKASPITYVRKDKPMAAFLIIHGTKDPLVDFQQSVRFEKALKEAGGSARLIAVEGEGHGWLGPTMLQSLNDTAQFLDQQLKKKSASLGK